MVQNFRPLWDIIKEDLNWSFEAVHPLKIIIVGAGIAGLASAVGLKNAGHNVEILEQVREIGGVGAGIQIDPNAAKIMGRFGLLNRIMQKANVWEKSSLKSTFDVVCKQAANVLEWTLNSHRPRRCTNHRGRYSANILFLTSPKSEIDTALKLYEGIRKNRGEKIQNSVADTRQGLHLPDGEGQRKRDEAVNASGRDGKGPQGA